MRNTYTKTQNKDIAKIKVKETNTNTGYYTIVNRTKCNSFLVSSFSGLQNPEIFGLINTNRDYSFISVAN